jgi:hypothetical protein
MGACPCLSNVARAALACFRQRPDVENATEAGTTVASGQKQKERATHLTPIGIFLGVFAAY